MRRLLAVLLLVCCATSVSSSAVPQPAPRRAPKRSYDPTVEELENHVQRAKEAVTGFIGRVSRFFNRNRHFVMATGGVLGLMHGGAAAFTGMPFFTIPTYFARML